MGGQPTAVPVTLMLVDTSGPEEFLELVRGGLSVAVDALDPASLIGLVGVSDSITLVDISGASHSRAQGKGAWAGLWQKLGGVLTTNACACCCWT